MIQIRAGVFETNSSSTHSLNICKKNEYVEWTTNPDIVFLGESWSSTFSPKNFDGRRFVTRQEVVDKAIQWNKEHPDKTPYGETIEDFFGDTSGSSWHKSSYALDESIYTYEDWEYNLDGLESYNYSYTSEHGDEIEIFGAYGYDG